MIEAAEVIEHCPRAVDIKWRAELLRELWQGHVFAVQLAVAILKGMQAPKLPQRAEIVE